MKQIRNQLATVTSSSGGHQVRLALAFFWLVRHFSHMQMKGKDNKNILI